MAKKGTLKLESIDKLIDSASGYLEAKLELIKLELREELAGFLIKAVLISLFLLLSLFMLLFLGFGTALWLNAMLNSNYAGFLIVGGILFLMIVFIGLLKFTNSGNRFLQKIIGSLVED